MEKGGEDRKEGLDDGGTASDWPLDCRGNLKIASTDQQLSDFLLHIKSSKTPAVINYDIDQCPDTTQHIRYTPTFQFFRDGEKVDEMYGAGEERLHDRLWLHS